jgi:hypothetical protein
MPRKGKEGGILMWVVDLVIACQKAKQRKERNHNWWYLDVEKLLKKQHERTIRQRAVTRKQRWW